MTVRKLIVAEIGAHTRARKRNVQGVLSRIYAAQDWVLWNVFKPHGVTALYWSFAFVFFYFGFQKPSPAQSPVRVPLSEFFPVFGIPINAGMLFIGTYEMFMGLLFLFKQLRLAFWFFIPHQLIGFVTLLVIPHVAFQPPYLSLLGVDIPWATTGYGEFVMKNVVFVAGFMLLLAVEFGDDETNLSGREDD